MVDKPERGNVVTPLWLSRAVDCGEMFKLAVDYVLGRYNSSEHQEQLELVDRSST